MDVIDWLLTKDAFIEYNTRVELLGQTESNKHVQNAKERMLKDIRIINLFAELLDWPGYSLKRHNDAKHLTHKLAFLVDIGVKKNNKTLTQVSKKIFEQKSEEGAFQVIVNIPTHFGGSGEDEMLWMLCDFPTILYSMLKIGWENDKRIEIAIDYLKELIRENGWPCASSPKLGGKFKGPGKKSDPCPYANLIILKALSQHPKSKNSKECKVGAETLLSLWERRKEVKPFLFGMGTDFKKLKAPFIWYDVLHITDVLTKFEWLHKDERLNEMIEIIRNKIDSNGFYKAESVWRAWKEWDFGQKKEPSPWITFLVTRLLRRIDR